MKKILILVISFLLTGCASVKYDLNIDRNLTVYEEVFITATKEYFSNFYKNYPKTIVQEFYNNEELMSPIRNNNYKYNLELKGKNPGLFVKKQYKSISDYVANTIFRGQSFENIITSTDNDIITINMNNYIRFAEDGDVGSSISIATITLKLPFVVTNSNADKVNYKTNTYEWSINEETDEKEINISFDKSKIYIYKNDLIMYISIAILIILFIILIIYISNAVVKRKRNNQIYE